MFHRAVPRVSARFEWSGRRGDAARESGVILSLQNHLRVDVKLDGSGLPWFPRGAMRQLAGCMVLLPIINSHTRFWLVMLDPVSRHQPAAESCRSVHGVPECSCVAPQTTLPTDIADTAFHGYGPRSPW